MRFTFTHRIIFRDGKDTAPYRSTQWWKTERGALRAAERHAQGLEQYYDNISMHALVVLDDHGRYVTSEAA